MELAFGDFTQREAYEYLDYFRRRGYKFAINGNDKFEIDDVNCGAKFTHGILWRNINIETLFNPKESLCWVFFYGDRNGGLTKEEGEAYKAFKSECEEECNRILKETPDEFSLLED